LYEKVYQPEWLVHRGVSAEVRSSKPGGRHFLLLLASFSFLHGAVLIFAWRLFFRCMAPFFTAWRLHGAVFSLHGAGTWF
jgi:hypothetical protein